MKKFAYPVRGRVLMMGDSITDDARYTAYLRAYLALTGLDQQVQFMNAGVSGETLSGLSEPDHPWPRPCGLERLDRALEATQPDWVAILYGINDGIYYPLGEERFAAYRRGVKEMVDRAHGAGCGVILMTPVPFDAASAAGPLFPAGQEKYSYAQPYEGYNEVMDAYADWIRSDMADKVEHIVDLNRALAEDRAALRAETPGAKTGDGIHPDDRGHWVIARTVAKVLLNRSLAEVEGCLTGTEPGREYVRRALALEKLIHIQLRETVGHGIPEKTPIPDEAAFHAQRTELRAAMEHWSAAHPALLAREDSFRGYRMERFLFRGWEGLMVFPQAPAADRRWAIRTEFFGAFADADEKLLEAGYHLAYLRLSDRYGAPEAVEELERFRRYCAGKYGLHGKVGLLGLSRGGLYAAHYGGTYPEHTAALYLDAPVVDIATWPKLTGGEVCWRECLRAYDLAEDDLAPYYAYRDRMHAVLTGRRIPLILVAGDSDRAVPYQQNGVLLEQRYRAAGAPLAVEVKPGVDHHPHGPTDPAAVARFWDEKGLW